MEAVMKKINFILLLVLLSQIIFAQNFENCEIYLWDNDNGHEFENPGFTGQFIGYEYNMVKSFEDLGFTESDSNYGQGIVFPSNPNELAAIFIVCGDRDTLENIFSIGDIDQLSAYMDGGGCLYIEGNNIADYLEIKYQDFLLNYFNIAVTSSGLGHSGYDTIRVDTTFNFFRSYSLVYPSGTAPDLGIDVFEAANALDSFYHSVLVFDPESKMYLSTAAAYTPPLPKNKEPQWKSYLSTVDFSAFAAPHVEGQIADTIENLLIRTVYLRDILRLFTIGKVLIVNHTPNEFENNVSDAMDLTKFDYDKIWISPGIQGPNYRFYTKYSSILWYSTGCNIGENITTTDITNLSIYLNYGGSMLMSGEDICQEIGDSLAGFEHPFLSGYFAIDYISKAYHDNVHVPALGGFYAAMGNYNVNNEFSPDVIKPVPNPGLEPFPAFNFSTSLGKAPLQSAVTNDAFAFKTVFFTFAIEDPVNQTMLTDMLNITLADLFKLDTTFVPKTTTGIENINVSYTYTNTSITFTILITSNNDGNIDLIRNGINENSVKTSHKQSYYKLISEYKNGLYIIEYSENGNIVSTFNVSIPSSGNNEEKVYSKNGVLYIESRHDNAEVSIYDITGKHIDKLSVLNGKTVWNRYANIPAGIYFVKFENTTGNKYKIVKY